LPNKRPGKHMTTYELRSPHGRPFMTFDSMASALRFRETHQQRAKVTLRLFEVERVEREIAA